MAAISDKKRREAVYERFVQCQLAKVVQKFRTVKAQAQELLRLARMHDVRAERDGYLSERFGQEASLLTLRLKKEDLLTVSEETELKVTFTLPTKKGQEAVAALEELMDSLGPRVTMERLVSEIAIETTQNTATTITIDGTESDPSIHQTIRDELPDNAVVQRLVTVVSRAYGSKGWARHASYRHTDSTSVLVTLCLDRKAYDSLRFADRRRVELAMGITPKARISTTTKRAKQGKDRYRK